MLFWTAVLITIVYYIVLFRLDKKRQAAYWAEQNAIAKAPLDLSLLEQSNEPVELVSENTSTNPKQQKTTIVKSQSITIKNPTEETEGEILDTSNDHFTKPDLVKEERIIEEVATEEKNTIDLTSGAVEGTNFLFDRLVEEQQEEEEEIISRRPKL